MAKKINDNKNTEFLPQQDWDGNKCPDEDTIILYLDEVLNESLRSKFIKHLNKCPNCREHMELLNEIKQDIKNEKDLMPLPINLKKRAINLFSLVKPQGLLNKYRDKIEIAIEWVRGRWELMKPTALDSYTYAMQITRGKNKKEDTSSWLIKEELDTCILEAYIENIKDDIFIIRININDKAKKAPLKKVDIKLNDLTRHSKEEVICDGQAFFEDVKAGVYKIELNERKTKLGTIYLKINKGE